MIQIGSFEEFATFEGKELGVSDYLKITQDIIKSVFKHEKFEEEEIKKVTPITNKKNIEDTIEKIKDFFRVEKTDNDKVVLTIDEKYDE